MISNIFQFFFTYVPVCGNAGDTDKQDYNKKQESFTLQYTLLQAHVWLKVV